MKRAKCKACGADIVFIPTKAGRVMPCDAQRIPYRDAWGKRADGGTLKLITEDGMLTYGTLDFESDKIGYQSHFATCPAADQFRRR